MLTNLGNVPYPTRGFPAVPEIFLHFSEACCSIPAISKTDPYPSLQLPKNPKTREPEITGPEPCTGMTRPDPVSQCGQVPPQIFPDSYYSIVLVVLFAIPRLVVFPESSKFLRCSFNVPVPVSFGSSDTRRIFIKYRYSRIVYISCSLNITYDCILPFLLDS